MTIALIAVAGFGVLLSIHTLRLMRCAGSCNLVFASPHARVFGFPNAWISLAYCLAIVVYGALRLAGVAVPREPALVASGLSVIMTAYLAWRLTFSVRRFCKVCVTGYALTVSIAVLLWLSR